MPQTSTRTTIDLENNLAIQLKQYSARHGLTQKQVVTHALTHYIGSHAQEQDAQKLWRQLRHLSQSGQQDIRLTQALRQDRQR